MRAAAGVALALVGWAAIASGGPADRAQGGDTCDRVIAPGMSVTRLVRSLHPGQTGCLRAGTYRGTVRIRRGGRPGRPVRLRNFPGQAATVLGRLVIYGRARFVRVEGLYLDGTNRRRLPSPSVAGDNVIFDRVSVTNNHTSICFTLGARGFGVAERVVIRRSRIHNCGRLPANNHEHGIYIARARDARVYGSWIQGNADRGIQLYPDAQRTVIRGNIVDNNGQGVAFGGEGSLTSNDTLVEGNLITNSALRNNVESFYGSGARPGSGNVVQGNCVSGGARDTEGSGGVDTSREGFLFLENLLTRPRYRSRLRGDLRFSRSHACASLYAGDPAFTPGPRP